MPEQVLHDNTDLAIPCSAEAIASVESILVGFAYITDVKEPAEPKNG